MQPADNEFDELFRKYTEDTMTPEEFRRWRVMLLDERNTVRLESLLAALAETDHSAFGQDAPLKEMYANIIRVTPLKATGKTPRRLNYRQYAWWAAAASLLLLVATGILRWQQPSGKQQLATKYDVAPGGSKAVLKLADGSVITLDSVAKRQIQLGNATAQQVNGQLNYAPSSGGEAAGINVLTTPRGGQFQVVLPDGTRVWLNAASSLSYPTAFTGKERLVEVSGEAYFEVAKDAHKPFRVKISNQKNYIDVLGTHFNVNAYPDEAAIRSTLLEGRIRFSAAQAVVLSPGQQAVLTAGTQTPQVVNGVDTSAVMAWRSGLFNFEGQHLREVMRQLARWYNIEVVYDQEVPDVVFGGKIVRNVSLTQLLKILTDAGIHFRLEPGGKLIIQPK
ncbi:FecR family protein [Chitinophaga sp. ARDCPP14]|uniref:FecR family protein n=1 Tax=Chitinophaga sp. ARDCPP14 TaxID=3391139 RepID=UPI003F51EC16